MKMIIGRSYDLAILLLGRNTHTCAPKFISISVHSIVCDSPKVENPKCPPTVARVNKSQHIIQWNTTLKKNNNKTNDYCNKAGTSETQRHDVGQKKLDTGEHIQYDSTYINLKCRQNQPMVTEERTVVTFVGKDDWVEEPGEVPRVPLVFYFLIWRWLHGWVPFCKNLSSCTSI